MRRIRNKRKKQGITTKVNKKRIKQKDYNSEGVSISTNLYALKIENIKIIFKLVLEFIGIIGGILLIFFNVRDEDFCLEISNFKLQCSLAGLAISIISIYALIKTNPKINIKNEIV